MQRDQIDLGTVKVSRLFRLYFFPTLMGMLSLCAVTAIDGIFVGHSTGSDGLAAVNICIAPTMVIVGIGLMFGVGASVVCSIHLARQRLKAARINATQALLAGVIAVLLFLALTLSAPRSTARILGCSDTLMPLVLDYMPWIFLCCLFQICGAIGLFIVRLDGAPRYAMWCNLIPALLNIVLDYVFMFPLGMGLMGAGIATLISCAVGGTMALVYLIGYAGQLRLIRFKLSAKSLRLTLRNLGYQCRIGISALLGEATMGMLMFMGNIVFMSYLGDPDFVNAYPKTPQ
jgi:Na+-driven multidrug efflux pump